MRAAGEGLGRTHSAGGALHPAELELRHYVRGTLASGHAVAILAHCLICRDCGRRLEERLGQSAPGPSLSHHEAAR
ncbi:MAG TPA: hypothetical protein QGG47_03245 [Acidobacteriota bacterium]|nr:hypothetical protein [Acidobacteriota bacterium]